MDFEQIKYMLEHGFSRDDIMALSGVSGGDAPSVSTPEPVPAPVASEPEPAVTEPAVTEPITPPDNGTEALLREVLGGIQGLTKTIQASQTLTGIQSAPEDRTSHSATARIINPQYGRKE